MKIACFFSEGCGSKDKLKKNIRKALLAEGMDAEVFFRVLSQEEAGQLGIGGSPHGLGQLSGSGARNASGRCFLTNL